jgi:UDP-glucose 4-epimerase
MSHFRYKIGERREGDVVETYSDTTKINRTLGWQASKTLDDALLSAWNWEKKLRGFPKRFDFYTFNTLCFIYSI